MEPKFWIERWEENRIGFHEDVFHPMLCKYWDTLSIDLSVPVFVPLCGKSRDLVWLRNRGHEVVGVELSEVAAQAFFKENNISAERHQDGPFVCLRGAGYTFFIGDFFDLTPDFINPISSVYDRAALIALPSEMRRNYVQHLKTLCSSEALGLLVTVSYQADQVSPPPFLVEPEEIKSLYNPWCKLNLLGISETKVKGAAGCESGYRLQVR